MSSSESSVKKGSVSKSSGIKRPADDDMDMSILETKFGYQVRIAERFMNRDFAQQIGMTPVQFSIFGLVASNPGLSQVAIGESLSMDRASTMTVVRKLELAGLIECRKSKLDRRMQELYLTAEGEAEFEKVSNTVADYDQLKTSKLNQQEKLQLMGLLAKLSA